MAIGNIFRTISNFVAGLHLDSLFTRDPDYLKKKFLVHRTLTCVMFVLFCLSGMIAWFIDNAFNSVAASETLWIRVASLWLLIPAFIIRHTTNPQKAAVLIVASVSADLLQSLAAFKLLGDSFLLGVGGFLYYPLGATLLCLGLSMQVSLICILLMALLPPCLGLLGWLTAFPYILYTAFMGPAAAITAILSGAFAWSYHRRLMLEQALEEASNTDPLTGVANRRHFQKLLQLDIARSSRFGQPCALLMLDIDHFKRINDTHGHPTGDSVIRVLADTCVHQSRQGDSVARLGGEEFAILMPGAEANDAANLGERIRESVEKLVSLSESGEPIKWTVSVGAVSILPSVGKSHLEVCEQLVSRADVALYKAKSSGRNCVVFLSEDSQ